MAQDPVLVSTCVNRTHVAGWDAFWNFMLHIGDRRHCDPVMNWGDHVSDRC